MSSTLDLIDRLAIAGNKPSLIEKNMIVCLYKKLGKKKIFEYAKKKKMVPFIARIFYELEFDPTFWYKHIEFYKERNTAVIGILSKIFADLHRLNISDVFVYENFGALLSSKSNIALFASGDVDVYAACITQKKEIYDILKIHGFTAVNEGYNSEKIKTEFFNKDLFQNGFGINIMWVPMSRLKLPFFIDMDYCILPGSLQNYKETEIRLPSNEALLYLCLLHISIHSYSRSPDIRLYIDIVNMCKLDVDWMKVIYYAEHDNTIVRVVTACILTNRLFNIEIPAFVLEYENKYSRISKLIKIVYDEHTNILKYEPNKVRILKIEAYSNNMNILNGVLNMIFPSKSWVLKHYNESLLIKAYLKHIWNLIS